MAYISQGLRGGKILIHDGFRYQKNIATKDKIWWTCWRKTCRAPLSSNIFDVNDDNAVITILEVSELCNSIVVVCMLFKVLVGQCILILSVLLVMVGLAAA